MAMAAGVGARADAGEAARHHLPALRRAGEEDAQAHRPRHQPAVHEGRRGRERTASWPTRPAPSASSQASNEARAGVAELRAEDRGVVGLEGQPGGERRADHHPVRCWPGHARARRPGRTTRWRCWAGCSGSPSSALGDARQEGEQRPGLEDAGAERVDQRHRALRTRADEAGRAEARAGVELERVGEGGVEPAPEHARPGGRPATVRTMTRPFSTVRSSPSSSMKPR